MEYVWAVQRPGPPEKVGYGNVTTRQGTGAVVHSAEGSLASALAVLESERQVSWHFTVSKNGLVYQHYDASLVCWHAGPKANPYYVGIECEGLAGEELTSPQADALCELLRWLHEANNWPPAQRDVTLFEHNHFMATSCPSGRIPWDYVLEALQRPPSEPGQPDNGSPAPASSEAPAAAAEATLYKVRAFANAILDLTMEGNLDHISTADRALLEETIHRP